MNKCNIIVLLPVSTNEVEQLEGTTLHSEPGPHILKMMMGSSLTPNRR